MHGPTQQFRMRTAVAIAAVISGATLPVTGLINHLLAFTPLTAARHAWMAAHNVMGIVFITACILHAYYNRRVLAQYFRIVVSKAGELSWELPVTFAVIALLFALALGHAYALR